MPKNEFSNLSTMLGQVQSRTKNIKTLSEIQMSTQVLVIEWQNILQTLELEFSKLPLEKKTAMKSAMTDFATQVLSCKTKRDILDKIKVFNKQCNQVLKKEIAVAVLHTLAKVAMAAVVATLIMTLVAVTGALVGALCGGSLGIFLGFVVGVMAGIVLAGVYINKLWNKSQSNSIFHKVNDFKNPAVDFTNRLQNEEIENGESVLPSKESSTK